MLDARVREASPEDALAIARVHVPSRRAAYFAFFPADYLNWLTIEYATQLWIERLSPSGAGLKTVVAEEERGIVGFVRFGHTNDPAPSPDAGAVELLFVHPDHWRRGIGSILLHDAETGLKSMGFSSGYLAAFEENEPARRFYERNGWTHDGETWVTQRGGTDLVQLRYCRALT